MKATVETTDGNKHFNTLGPGNYITPIVQDNGTLLINEGNINCYTERTIAVFPAGYWKYYEVEN